MDIIFFKSRKGKITTTEVCTKIEAQKKRNKRKKMNGKNKNKSGMAQLAITRH